MPNMAVFCSSLTSLFPGMLLTYFLNYFEMVPVALIITGITFVFTFHMPLLLLLLSLSSSHCSGDKIGKNEMSGARSVYGKEQKRLQGFGRETWGKESTWVTQA
jgi:hypothetical protein